MPNKSHQLAQPKNETESYSQLTSRFAIALALVLPSIVIVVSLWLPFGLRMTGLIEEWDLVGLFNTNQLFFIATPYSQLPAHCLRPLTIFPQALAYFLYPNSFALWHVGLIIALLLKGISSAHLIWRATNSTFWAMVMGQLVLIYPADTMQLSFRSLHINWALALVLLSSSLFVIAYEWKHQKTAYLLCLGATMLLLIACCMYEVSLSLILLPLLVLFVTSGMHALIQQLRTRLTFVFTWFAGGGLYVAYLICLSQVGPSYQSSLCSSSTISVLISSLPKLFSIGALRGLVGGWFDAIRIVSTEFSSFTYLLTVTTTIAITTLLLEKLLRHLRPTGYAGLNDYRPRALRLTLAGLLLMLCGYTPFLFSPAHQVISQRTFLFATPGAVMVWLGLLIAISAATRLVAGTTAISLVFLGLAAQLFQFHHYTTLAEKQCTLLRTIIENFDGELGDKTLVVLDGSNQLGHTWMLPPGKLNLALTYLYAHPINSVQVCHASTMEWQLSDNLGRKGKCIKGEKHWSFCPPSPVTGPTYRSSEPQPLRLPTSRIVQVVINSDGSGVTNPILDNYRTDLRNGNTITAKRYREVLQQEPWPLRLTMFKDQTLSDSYRWDFGNWWSLELPIRGSGWRDAEWSVNGLHQNAFGWKTQKESSLFFDLVPSKSPYVLRVRFESFVNDAIRRSLKIRFNRILIPYHWNSDGTIEANLRRDFIHRGTNEIDFNTDIDQTYYGLSAKLDWFEIAPLHRVR